MRGALVPHAPALLPEVTRTGEQLHDIWHALSRIGIGDADLVVVLSSHAPKTGIYRRAAGSLAGFGLPEISGSFVTTLTEGVALDDLDGTLDHGALVPLMLLKPTNEVMVIGLANGHDVGDVVEAVRDLARARDVYVLASGHTSVRLTEKAPLPYSSDAVRLETRFITEVANDCVVTSELAEEFATVGGSCSAPTLHAFGRLFTGTEGTVLGYGSPFGVGYPVITAQTDV